MLIILGPTATGKTKLAAALATQCSGEIISADSRQVFRGMDIGSGKDLQDYKAGETSIPYHLIDIANAGEEYSVYNFSRDFHKAYDDILSRGKFPILCGGTGLYIESVVKSYRMQEVPMNPDLRDTLAGMDMEALTDLLKTYRRPHSTTDTVDRERLLRALEIEEYYKTHNSNSDSLREIKSCIVGIHCDRAIVMQRIRNRLAERLENGMIEEVQQLLASGIPPQSLIRYGLEYKYLTQYLLGEYSYEEMFEKLNIAIRQFAKRQMTWFRRMERSGIKIHWISSEQSMEEKVGQVLNLMIQEGLQ
jgi:tRNA dimethylallyltransferase